MITSIADAMLDCNDSQRRYRIFGIAFFAVVRLPELTEASHKK